MNEWYGNRVSEINKNIFLSITEIILLLICLGYMVLNDMFYFRSDYKYGTITINTQNEIIYEED